ncbi:MAG: type IV pilin protein [Candidatus Omnitrophota bacterium]
MEHLKNNNGFTIVETIVVVIIVGVLAALTIPNYTFIFEKTKSAEGLQILESIRKAQWGYYYEHGNIFTGDLDDLDISIPTPEHFDPISDATILAAASPSDDVATITRVNGLYTLNITADGDITCSAAGDTCSKIGF